MLEEKIFYLKIHQIFAHFLSRPKNQTVSINCGFSMKHITSHSHWSSNCIHGYLRAPVSRQDPYDNDSCQIQLTEIDSWGKRQINLKSDGRAPPTYPVNHVAKITSSCASCFTSGRKTTHMLNKNFRAALAKSRRKISEDNAWSKTAPLNNYAFEKTYRMLNECHSEWYCTAKLIAFLSSVPVRVDVVVLLINA